MALENPGTRHRGLSIETVHWHILREDQHRTNVSIRTGSVLSTNALLIAGTALALSVDGREQTQPAVAYSAVGTLTAVAVSVALATMALVTPKSWTPKSDDVDFGSSMAYAYGHYDHRWATFDEFRASIADLSAEQQLRGATLELWKAAYTHQYRYRKLRLSIHCLVCAIGLLLLTVGLGVVIG